jgi:hypothetical protein
VKRIFIGLSHPVSNGMKQPLLRRDSQPSKVCFFFFLRGFALQTEKRKNKIIFVEKGAVATFETPSWKNRLYQVL